MISLDLFIIAIKLSSMLMIGIYLNFQGDCFYLCSHQLYIYLTKYISKDNQMSPNSMILGAETVYPLPMSSTLAFLGGMPFFCDLATNPQFPGAELNLYP